MLLRLYYLHEMSPRKWCELSDLVDNLKEVFEFPEGGNLPYKLTEVSRLHTNDELYRGQYGLTLATWQHLSRVQTEIYSSGEKPQ